MDADSRRFSGPQVAQIRLDGFAADAQMFSDWFGRR